MAAPRSNARGPFARYRSVATIPRWSSAWPRSIDGWRASRRSTAVSSPSANGSTSPCWNLTIGRRRLGGFSYDRGEEANRPKRRLVERGRSIEGRVFRQAGACRRSHDRRARQGLYDGRAGSDRALHCGRKAARQTGQYDERLDEYRDLAWIEGRSAATGGFLFVKRTAGWVSERRCGFESARHSRLDPQDELTRRRKQ